ncbi:uncharacterized protein LOC119735255 [Patiria miniata]|uniref:Integrase catalytic domain-containing protein n=1 Tax=Patiria miniata TaxID=46514 RepID=A0A914AMC1_PATMI|nr:uncharacterized protein LOC119735255 [Patiria miniata]
MCEEWSVTHVTSSPRYPRSNGMAERTVRTVKSVMKKCHETGLDINKAMLLLRATPIDAHLPSPPEILFGRPPHTTLPSRDPTGTYQKPLEVNDRLASRRDEMKANHDKHAGPDLPSLYVGQKVRILDQPNKSWTPGEVTKVCKEPRSYEVRTPNGSTHRRNRSHLREMQPQPREAHRQAKQAKRVHFDEQSPRVLFPPRQGSDQNKQNREAQRDGKPTDGENSRQTKAKPKATGTFLQTPQTTRSGRVTKIPARYL